MDSPSVPLLVLAVFGATGMAIRRARAAGVLEASEARRCFGLVAALAAWTALSGFLAASGAYLDPRVLRFLPLLVGFLVPVAVVALGLRASAALREALRKLVTWLPLRWLLGVQAIRVTALGTILKYADEELPGHFILPVGVPDFLIGLTALPLAVWVAPRAASMRGVLIAWNVLGSGIFLYAGLALHFSVPTPLQLFSAGPTTEAVFRFPLALVPTLLVPFFVGVHVATLWRLTARAD